MLKHEWRRVNCETSGPWSGLSKQMDKPGLQCVLSSAWSLQTAGVMAEKTWSRFRDGHDVTSFSPTLHHSRHHLLTDWLHSANQLHRPLTYDDLTFENELLTLI